MTEIQGQGNVGAAGPVQGSWISGQGRVIAGGRVYSSQLTMRQRWFQDLGVPAERAERTDMGQEVEHTFVIYESGPMDGGVRQYDLRIDGEPVWSGAGDDRVEALLEAVMAATGESDELPDN